MSEDLLPKRVSTIRTWWGQITTIAGIIAAAAVLNTRVEALERSVDVVADRLERHEAMPDHREGAIRAGSMERRIDVLERGVDNLSLSVGVVRDNVTQICTVLRARCK